MSAERGTQSAEAHRRQVIANEGRDYTIYSWSMDAATKEKWRSVRKVIIPIKPGMRIVDKGAGTGSLTELIAQENPEAFVHPQDYNPDLLERQERNKLKSAEVIIGDITEQNLPDNSVDIQIFSSVGHEVKTFGGQEKLDKMLEVSYRELKAEGQIIIRDFKKAESKTILMQIMGDDGTDNPEEAKIGGELDYSKLSTRALFKKFHEEFQGGNKFEYREVVLDGVTYYELDLVYAHEFYLHKDYTANWRNEIKETYTYWTEEEAQEALTLAGFVDVQFQNDPNAYILENRLIGKIQLFNIDQDSGSIMPIDFPSTHMVVSARKPKNESGEDVVNLFVVPSPYPELIKSIGLDEENREVVIGSRRFKVKDIHPAKGTKKRVFWLETEDGETPKVLKVVLEDEDNQHGMFKAMHQSVDRIHELNKRGIPTLRIVKVDPDGPPYRWFIQEAIPENAISAVELVRENKLTEADVRQMCEIVNKFELEKVWQVDTNPFNWYKILQPDGTTKMTYTDGKVYFYDEHWTFAKVGLIQWLNPEFVSRLDTNSAHIPDQSDYERLKQVWTTSNEPVLVWFRNHLHPTLQPNFE